jgi:hypothetical protein
MKTFEKLIQNSISAALSAIEIYNKPDFKYRNEIFVVLIINSWELLLKAKILSDNNDDINSIYVTDSQGNIKTSRNNTPLTVEIKGAMNELNLNDVLKDNLLIFIEIRDSIIHFISNKPLDYVIFTLGTACLKNYQKSIQDWFDRSLLEYNFYILPMGFAHHFKTYTLLDIDGEPAEIQNFLANISVSQSKVSTEGFYFLCDIEMKISTAKNVTSNSHLTANIDPTASNATLVVKTQKLTDKYPLSSDELWQKVRQALPNVRQNDYYRFIREKKIKENS